MSRLPRRGALLGAIVLVGLFTAGPALAQCGESARGGVDGSRFIELLGDDAVVVEVSIGKSLLRAIVGSDPGLEEVAGGLECIYALVIALEEPELAARAREEIRAIDRRLIAAGWERLARVKDKGSEVKVLLQIEENGETVNGLVVMIVDTEDDEPALVFANVAGRIDLAAIEDLGDALEFPGLEDLDIDFDD